MTTIQDKEILVRISLKYDRTSYDPLKKLAVLEHYNPNTKLYDWYFKISALNQISAILGHSFDFSDEKEAVVKLVRLCPGLKESVEIDGYKGLGYIQITRMPDFFELVWPMRKIPTHQIVPIENIKVLWEVIKKYPKGKKIKTSTIAEHYCDALKITRFHRKTGTFDWQKMSGCREVYLKFYGCLKTLQHYFLAINHHRHGEIERLKNQIDWQLKLTDVFIS